MTEDVRAWSGRPLQDITLEDARAGLLGADDLRIHPDTLGAQAAVARANGNPQLASALALAAEIATLDEDEVLDLYESLRPHRSTASDLEGRAVSLADRGLVRCAAMVREAATWGARRGLLS